MEYTEALRAQNDQFWKLITEGAILSKVVLGILCCMAASYLLFALYKTLRRKWYGIYYVMICACILLSAACSLMALLSPDSSELLNVLRIVGIIPLPALLCLHIKKQLSYKKQNLIPAILLFFVPAFLILLLCRDLFFPQYIPELPPHSEQEWYTYGFYCYALVAMIRACTLCFSVFYQMPRRTRRSTRYMLISVTSLSALLTINVLWVDLSRLIPQGEVTAMLLPLGMPIALLVFLYALNNAMHVMPATEVIVTSREFVVSGLSTTIYTLNRRKEILDWNRKEWEGVYPLPKPQFKEPIDVYRKRMLEQSSCRISPHSDDIIIAKLNDEEKHFLLRSHEATSHNHHFGYVIEIVEVTPIYTLMRYFEQIARYDQLTGLFNRNAYMNRAQSIAIEENLPLLIMVGDVNKLKHINDTHGHILGDQLLTTVAEAIKKTMPSDAFAARVGGDEFVVLISKGNLSIAEQLIGRIKTLCNEIHHDMFGSPSISWGYALMTSLDQTYNDVFSEADTMMYNEKKGQSLFRSSGLLPENAEKKPTL